MSGQKPKKTFEEWFAKTEEFKNTYDTVLFLGEETTKIRLFGAWTAYAKSTAIKVLENVGKNSEFTLIHIKKLFDIGDVSLSEYSYGEMDVDGDQQLADEQPSEDVDKCKPAAVIEEPSIFQPTLLPSLSILELTENIPQSASASVSAQSTAVPAGNITQSTTKVAATLGDIILFPLEVSKKINPVLFIIHHASNAISYCIQHVIDEDAAARAGFDFEIDENSAARAALTHHVTETSVDLAWADPYNTLFSTTQPTNS
jgi:hypothetical protein